MDRYTELRSFVLVAEKGSFSAAARQLGVSPSAISKIVARLEARLGTQLLLRSTRKVQLTPEGCQLYERGQRVLADLNEVEMVAAARSAPMDSATLMQPRANIRVGNRVSANINPSRAPTPPLPVKKTPLAT